ncbi:MAG TPA: nuclear transport factor 2 family protein, partial [Thermoanaerobaculia bacterium]|nr:nuclear transport factor 2 family protein [Thermoanaerobaculia bacterium]
MKGSPDETAVAAANLAFYRALEARDLSAMELVWLHEEEASCIHPGWHRLDGWSEIRRSWENIFANARPWSVSYEDLRVRVSGDVAWVTCVELLAPFGSDPEDGAA